MKIFDIASHLKSGRKEKEGHSFFLPINALYRCLFDSVSTSISTQSLELGFVWKQTIYFNIYIYKRRIIAFTMKAQNGRISRKWLVPKKTGFVWRINMEGNLKDRIKSETMVQVCKTPSPTAVKLKINLPKH